MVTPIFLRKSIIIRYHLSPIYFDSCYLIRDTCLVIVFVLLHTTSTRFLSCCTFESLRFWITSITRHLSAVVLPSRFLSYRFDVSATIYTVQFSIPLVCLGLHSVDWGVDKRHVMGSHFQRHLHFRAHWQVWQCINCNGRTQRSLAESWDANTCVQCIEVCLYYTHYTLYDINKETVRNRGTGLRGNLGACVYNSGLRWMKFPRSHVATLLLLRLSPMDNFI